MKRYTFITLIAILTIFFHACQNENLNNLTSAGKGITIQANIGSPFTSTRSNPLGTETEQGQFVDGDVIAVSLDEGQTWVEHKKNGDTWEPQGGKKLAWPEGKEQAEVWAYYPVEHTNASDGSNNSTFDTFTLPRHQCNTQGGQEGDSPDCHIAWADRMAFRSTMQKPADNVINLSMVRQAACVDIRITKLSDNWNTGEAFFQIGDNLYTPDINLPAQSTSGSYHIYPKNGGKKLKLNDGVTCLLLPQEADPDAVFFEMDAYPTEGAAAQKLTVKGQPKLEAGMHYTFNLQIGKSGITMGSVSIEPWSKVSFADAAGKILPVMIVKDGLAHIYLNRATNGTAQIADSIRSAERKHLVHDLVFYGNKAGKLDLSAANNMLKATDVRSVNLSAVTDLTEIEPYSFRSQDYSTEFSKLEEVYLPESVTKIGQSAFEGNSIQKITTPGVEVLGEAAFKNCKKLESITLNKLTGTLPSYSFENCIVMNSAYMPKITEIAEYAFKSAGLNEGNQGHVDFSSVTYIHSYAFEHSSITGGIYPKGEVPMGLNVTNELTFPNVTQIDDRAFSCCRQLFAISFPKANRLGDYIFSGCNWLSTIMFTVKGSIEYIGAKQEPFSRDIRIFPETDGIMLDYHTNMANYYYGLGTLIVHEDKMYTRSVIQPRVTDYRHYIGYADDRGRAQFGLVNKSGPWWQDVVYVNDAGKKYLGAH
nr:leucine-rich repeat protein [uncultured Bacteroides sp.]